MFRLANKRIEKGNKQNGSDLTNEDLLDAYSTMVLLQALDKRIWIMNRQGKAAIVASSQGHEAAQLGSFWALKQHSVDPWFFPYYRDLGIYLAAGINPAELMIGYMAKKGEPLSGARQFPLHGADLSKRIINQSNVVATQVPHAVGSALASKIRGEKTVTNTYFGDGASSEGDVHEAMNFASIHKLPVIFLCENNKYAISVPQKLQMAVDDISLRASGYGMPSDVVDGTDFLQVYNATVKAVQRALNADGPTLIEAKLERFLPHTSDDDDTRYREPKELELAKQSSEPVAKFKEFLISNKIMTKDQSVLIDERAKTEVNSATSTAESSGQPDGVDFYEHVYATKVE